MEENSSGKRDLSEKWIDNNVYQALEKIEEYYRMMINGCSDLLEYIENYNNPSMIIDIQLKNMELMINELEILMENTKELIKKEEYDKVKKEWKEISNKFNNGERKGDKRKKIFIRYYNYKGNQRAVILTPLFKELKARLGKLRSKIIDYLSDILFAKSITKTRTKEI